VRQEARITNPSNGVAPTKIPAAVSGAGRNSPYRISAVYKHFFCERDARIIFGIYFLSGAAAPRFGQLPLCFLSKETSPPGGGLHDRPRPPLPAPGAILSIAFATFADCGNGMQNNNAKKYTCCETANDARNHLRF